VVTLFRRSWDVVVAVVGGDPAAGYLDGVYVAGRRKDKRTVRVRHHGHPPDVVAAVLADMTGDESHHPKVTLHGYSGGEIPTYYAQLEDLEVLGGGDSAME
jgi:hypothetical protein